MQIYADDTNVVEDIDKVKDMMHTNSIKFEVQIQLDLEIQLRLAI